MRLLDAARRALDDGWNVLPVNARKGPHHALLLTGHSKLNDEGRRVPSWKVLQTEQVTVDHLKVWFDPKLAVPGFGAVTGAISGRVVLDFDGEAGQTLCRSWGLPPSALSGSGSPHLYVAHPGWPVRTVASGGLQNPPFPGLDVRGDGGMIVLPPSVLNNGPYRSVTPGVYLPGELPEAVGHWTHLACPPPPLPPLWTADEVSARDSADTEELLHQALSRLGGGRNNAGYWLARQLCNVGVPHIDAREIMRRFVDHVSPYDSRGRPDPYTFRHALSSLESAYRTPQRRLSTWHRPGGAENVLDEARKLARHLTLTQRSHLARLLAGSYARAGETAAREALRAAGLDEAVVPEVISQLQSGVSIPGTARLRAFLKTYQAAR